MRLVLGGINHHEFDVDARERFALSDDAARAALRVLQAAGAQEAVIFSTCNRTEILAAVADGGKTFDPFEEVFADAGRSTAHTLLFNDDVVRHLFRLASGLDSAALGEPQIRGQIASSLRIAREMGLASGQLGRTIERALHAGRRVRMETGLTAISGSYTGAAVEVTRGVFERMSTVRALVVGAGAIGSRVARRLRSEGCSEITVLSRTQASASEALPETTGARAGTLAELSDALGRADIVITALKDSPGIVTAELVAAATRARGRRPLLLFDMAVPRNVSEDVSAVAGAYLHDMDDLKGVLAFHLAEAKSVVDAAEAQVGRELERFLERERERDLVPTIVALRERLASIQAEELEHHVGKQVPAEAVAVAHAVTSRLFHELLTALKDASHRGEAEALQAAAGALFGLATPAR